MFQRNRFFSKFYNHYYTRSGSVFNKTTFNCKREYAARGFHEKSPISGIKYMIAVASGKGGVGKSTTSINLALSLQNLNQKVGVLDADIYGPSIPTLLNVKGYKPDVTEEKKLIPIESMGLKCMSMGFIVPEDSALIWRGPMVMSALNQMLREVDWGELDVLVIDLPPGTGDAVLTLCQNIPLSGAVIVSTPQDLALIDAKRAISMFGTVNVPVLGMVENMSYFECPNCNHQSEIFGRGGAKKAGEDMELTVLGEVPLEMDIRSGSDSGIPISVSSPNSTGAKAYENIAQNVLTALNDKNGESEGNDMEGDGGGKIKFVREE